MRLLSRTNSGFSLVELLILLSLIAIVATLAIPSYRLLICKTRVRVTTAQLMRLITQAREMAIHYQTAVIICGSQSGIDCDGEWAQGQLIAIKQPRKELSAYPELAQGIRVEWRSNLGHNQFLEFGPMGLPEGQWGSFWLSVEGELKARITVNLMGHLRVSEGFKLKNYNDFQAE